MRFGLVDNADPPARLQCSTPYGDNAIWTWRPRSADARGGQTCSTPYGDNAIWTPCSAHRYSSSAVLNALRRQCDLDLSSSGPWPTPASRAQRLTATMRFGPDWLYGSASEPRCSTPYGDNAIWTSNRAIAQSVRASAQRLTATMRFGRPRHCPRFRSPRRVLNALRRQCDLDVSRRPLRVVVACVLNALRRQCDLDSRSREPTIG